jgi:hypothetical protein
LPVVPTGEEALATAGLATLGCGDRSPVRTRSPSALASSDRVLLMVEAAEICRSSTSLRAISRSLRAWNCTVARLVASAAMSIPLPAPSAVTIEDESTMLSRTAARGAG